jgi:hypothetical protein
VASLNADGTRIIPANYTFRNVGQVITVNKLTEVGDIEVQVDAIQPPVIATYELTDTSIQNIGRHVKQVTDASLNGVERHIHLDAETRPTPQIADELVARTVVRGDRIVKVTESYNDSVIERSFDE